MLELTQGSLSSRVDLTHWASWWLSGKESACQWWRPRRHRFDPRIKKIAWRRKWQPTPVFLPGKPHEQRSPAGYSPKANKELDVIEQMQHLTNY